MPISFKVSKISLKFKPKQIVSELSKITKTFAEKDLREQFDRTIQMWRHKIVFSFKHISNKRKSSSSISTKDKIYSYVSLGTKRRYAIMSKDFVAKTRPNLLLSPNLLDSRYGTGRVVFIMKKKKFLRPGIKPRNFDKTIAKYMKPEFITYVNEQILEILEKF